VLLLVTAVVYQTCMPGGLSDYGFAWQYAWHVLTSFGATLWGSPVGLREFGLDWRSGAGAAIVLCTAMVALRAAIARRLGRVALPLGLALMGYCCMASVAMSRPYLGNWHVQYALPAVCGAYAAAFVLWRSDRSVFSAVPFFGLLALLTSCLYGYYQGFTFYGPDFNRYIRSIESYSLRNLVEPGLPQPYPVPDEGDLDARTFLFLAAHGHPLFAELPPPKPAGRLPEGARVYLDDAETPSPVQLKGGEGRVSLLTVVVEGSTSARGVRARMGATEVVLYRVHPLHAPPVTRIENATHFMAVLVPHRLPTGAHPVEFEIFE
jgi:hypothetical protein